MNTFLKIKRSIFFKNTKRKKKLLVERKNIQSKKNPI